LKIYNYILLIIIGSLNYTLTAQTAEKLNQISKEYLKVNLDSSAYFAKKAFEQAKQSNQYSQAGFALKNQGTVWYYKHQKKKAIQLYRKAINYFDKAKAFNESANLYHNLGLINYKLGYNKKSIQNYRLAIFYKKKSKQESDLESTYNGLAVLYQDMSLFDSSSYYLSLALNNINQRDTQKLANIYNSLGRNYIYQGIHDSALYYYTKSYQLKKNQPDTLSLALTIENIGQTLSAESNYDTAMSCYLMALDIYKKFDNPQATARVFNNIGNIYMSLDDTIKSKDNYLKALNIYISTVNKIGEAGIYNNLGLLEERNGEYQHAKQYYLKANKIFKEEKSYRNLAKSFQNLASIANKTQTYNDAKYYLNKSNKIALSHQLVNIYYENNYTLANLFHLQNNDIEAGSTLSQINNAQAKKYLNEEDYLSRLHLASIIYATQNKYKDAYQNLSNYDSLYKKYFNSKFFKEIAEITTKYKTEQIEKENEIFKKQSKIERLKLDNQREENKTNKIVILSTLFVLLASFFGLFLLYKNNRVRKKFNDDLISKNIIISEQNNEIEQTLNIVEKQKSILEEQKEEITDSINYAKRFQTAIIPTTEKLTSIFKNAFVLYQPKNIVSGDFFYIHQNEKYKYFVAADCTGHGVPGAFLSIIGHNGLNGAINKFNLTEIADIMKFLNQYLFDFLHQNQDIQIQDGIDLTIVRIDEQNKEISFSGAYNPLVVVRKGILKAYKTNKFAVGTNIENVFETQNISYQENDMLYLFSDGYADQFGGPKGKKFMRKRFYSTLSDLSNMNISEQNLSLDNILNDWMKREDQVDDILVAGIRL